MINKIYILIILALFNFSLIEKTYSAEQFNFNVTEIEILENGNLFKGIKRGTISSDAGIIINADYFEYDKLNKKIISSEFIPIKSRVRDLIYINDHNVSLMYLENNNSIGLLKKVN